MRPPAAELPPGLRRVVAEVRSELRERPTLPPGEMRFSLARTHRLQRDTLRMLLELHERYGPVFTVRAFHRPLVVLIGAEANHFVTVSEPESFSWRKGLFGEYLAPLIGDGLITTDGEYHDRARRIMMPAFHRRRLDPALAMILSETETALASWRGGEGVDLYRWVRDLAMGVAMRAVVGLDPRQEGVGHEAAALFERVLAYTNAEVWATLLRGPGTPWARMQAARRDLDEIIYAEIRRRRERGGDGEDILSMLIEARDEGPDGSGGSGAGFTDTELRDQLMHMLFGGHDTSSSTLAFLFYELARHPAALARIVAEQDTVLSGRAPTVEELMTGLPQLRMAVEETLRLYPPVWFGPRLAVKSFEFAGYRVPPGTHIMHSSWITHHLPEVFPDPEAFVPERFTPEARRAIPRGGYMPFGAGPRICIGKRFGQLVVEAVATAILQRFRLELRAGYVLRLEKLPTLSPGNGMPMVVRARRSGAAK
jgi:cytochrome P450